MKKILIIVSLFVFGLSAPVYAALDQKDVQKILDKVQAGKGFDAFVGDYPSDQVQTVSFKASPGLFYEIDLKAKVCYVLYLSSTGGGISLVPCKIIKDGYPLMAPLINWEK